MKSDADPGVLSLPFAEGLHVDFLRDPSSVPADWRAYFEALDRAPDETRNAPSGGRDLATADLQDRVDQLVRAYRVRGHMNAKIDPLGLPRAPQPELDPAFYGFAEADLDRRFSSRTVAMSRAPRTMTLREILERLRNTYCRSIGVQFMHIDDLGLKQWLQERMEATENRLAIEPEEQLRILKRLTDATVFEDFLQKKYLGAKSFSLEGSESLIPLLELAIDEAGAQGQDEIVLGMAHRGRLNVLANIMGKSPGAIFREFEDKDAGGHGDVKYHLGYSHDWRTRSGKNVHLSLCFNPSHLEYVNPVALGRMRAKQDRTGDVARKRGMALLIHGDASFAGEGVVQEMLNLSQLDGYCTGGTLHVIVNNQIGFTTPPEEGRSTVYASDVAKMLQSPIFHVNGEDPEAVAQVVKLAMEFRLEFARDVVIDMYGYRRRGHNEGDEPAFTQPVLYRAIRNRKPVREAYVEHLLQMGGVTALEANALARERGASLEAELALARGTGRIAGPPASAGIWKEFQGGPERDTESTDGAGTGVEIERLASLLERTARVPSGFHPHPKIERFLGARRAMAAGSEPLDWSAGEALAFATLAVEGTRVRLTGQDSARGTFSHRHAVLHDVNDGRPHAPLQHLDPAQAPVEIVNSPLSEIGVLGFEYGYSLDYPDGLVAWEAQFGDFVNCAQVIVDQFIAAAEAKWQRLSGITLLLPHGFEGQGPEHSSARLERFLALGAGDNLQVAYPSTPAQYFHLLRRQVRRTWRKPLVVMTPKSLLRSPLATSRLEELGPGTRFQRVLEDTRPGNPSTSRVLVCSGKIYYELAREREERNHDDVAILRLEQLYPLGAGTVEAALRKYAAGTPVVWVQEEPGNMGAWRFLHARAGSDASLLLGRFPLRGVCRPTSPSPASGSAATHQVEQRQLIEEAFDAG